MTEHMNELELKELWRRTNEKLEATLVLNKRNMEDIARVQVHSMLGSMKPLKIFTLVVGLLWVGIGLPALGWIYVNAFAEANKFFLFSATVQVVITAVALVLYIHQLTRIYQVEVYDPILRTQQRLVQLKIATLWEARIMFLQLPVWTTFWWNETMLTEWSVLQWAVPLFFTVAFTVLAAWLFINIKYENRNKAWFKLIFSGNAWRPLMRSMELVEQLDEYKADANVGT